MTDVSLLYLQNGDTSLHVAAYDGHTDTCEMLLKYNADVNATRQVNLISISLYFLYIIHNLNIKEESKYFSNCNNSPY